jgi:hypothetical protein
MMAVIEQHAGAVERYLSTVSPGPCVPWRDASFAVLAAQGDRSRPLAGLCLKNEDCNRRASR